MTSAPPPKAISTAPPTATARFYRPRHGPNALPDERTRRRSQRRAIHKAAGVGQPVTQQIAISVKGDSVSCAINGTVVGTYPKTDLITDGKLKSTDGTYGIRFAHNTDATVTDLKITKP